MFCFACWLISSLESGSKSASVLSLLSMAHIDRHLSKAYLFSCNHVFWKSLKVFHFYKINSKFLGPLKALCDLALIIFSDLILYPHTRCPLFQPHWTPRASLSKLCAFVPLCFTSCSFCYLKHIFQISPGGNSCIFQDEAWPSVPTLTFLRLLKCIYCFLFCAFVKVDLYVNPK